jgi:hypothetical protein
MAGGVEILSGGQRSAAARQHKHVAADFNIAANVPAGHPSRDIFTANSAVSLTWRRKKPDTQCVWLPIMGTTGCL